MALVEINKRNPFYQVCPICGHSDWCATSTAIDDRTGKPVLFIICKRDVTEMSRGNFNFVGKSKGNSNEGPNSKYLVTDSSSFGDVIQQNIKQIKVFNRFEDEKLDKLNRKFLSLLTVEEPHRNILNAGGITDEMIDYFNIKSFPRKDSDPIRKTGQYKVPKRWEICKKLQEISADLTGYPGAHVVTGKGDYWTLNGPESGILFTLPTWKNHLVKSEIRRDVVHGSQGKYCSMSSAASPYHEFVNGCGPGGRYGLFLPPILGDTSILYITEGAKKAMSIAWYQGYPAITVPGVSNWRELFEPGQDGMRPIDAIKNRFSIRYVILAFDGDKNINMHVKYNNLKLGLTCLEEGFQLGEAYWDSYMGKGIDDVLANKYKVSFWLYSQQNYLAIKKEIEEIELLMKKQVKQIV